MLRQLMFLSSNVGVTTDMILSSNVSVTMQSSILLNNKIKTFYKSLFCDLF